MKRTLVYLMLFAALTFAFTGCDKPAPGPDTPPVEEPDPTPDPTPDPDPDPEPDPDPTPDPEPAKVPVADLLDVVFSQDGSAKDVSANKMPITLVDSPATVTFWDEDRQMWVSHFNHAGSDVTSGYYKCDYSKGDQTDRTLSEGFSMETLFCIDKKSDGALEWKMFSAMDSGGLGFLISKTARGCALTFLPSITTSGSNNYIWCSSQINPEPGRYYHAVGVWDKAEGVTRIYVDGELKGTAASPGSYFPQKNANAYWFAVGGDSANGKCNSGWKGDVAIARVFSKSLTAEEVKALYDASYKEKSTGSFFCIDDINFVGDCTVAAGNKFCIYGNGFAAGDKIRFESISDRSKSFTCETVIESGVAKAVIPATFASDSYRIVAVRGSQPYYLGKATISFGTGGTDPAGVKVVAHRGLHTTAPENSVAALKAAQDINVYGSEFDIWLTTDGRCVVNHDSSFSGDSHVIQNSTYADLASVRLSNGEPAPTLEAYLEQGLQKPAVKLVCEIKTHSTTERNHACFDAAWKLIQDRHMEDQVVWIAFDWDLSNYIHSQAPSAHVQYLCSAESKLKTPAEIKAAGISGIDYKTTIMDAHIDFFDKCRALGIASNVWTVDVESDMIKYLYHGADYITTNKPVELQELTKKVFIEK